jgi:hypothetical protein
LDYYQALGLARDASVEEIERAYRALARKVHPDRNADDSARADARMKQLNQIRDTLTDPLLRAAYDDELRRTEQGRRRNPAPPAPVDLGEPPPPPAAPPSRPSAPGPHPHVAPFLRTHSEVEHAFARARRRDPGPVLALLALGIAVVGAAALLWPADELPEIPAVAQEPLPAAPAAATPAEGVVVIRADASPAGRALRNTAKVVPVGASFDEVVARFGAPDAVERGDAAGDLVLVYGSVRVAMREGRVHGGAP